MPVHNADIAAAFDEIADLLELKGDNPFRIRAYRNAARTIGDLGGELRDKVERNEDLTEIPGIGKDLAAKITEFVTAGRVSQLEELRKELPAGITDLLRLPGLGPKRVKMLYDDLKIHDVEQLEKAARDGKIRILKGFGEKIEAGLLQTIGARLAEGKRFRRASIAPYAEGLLAYLRAIPGVTQVELAGSYRRARETIGDLDVLVSVKPVGGTKSTPRRGGVPSAETDRTTSSMRSLPGNATQIIMDRFTAYDEVQQVLAKGDTKSSVVLRSGLQVDLRVVPPESFGAALVYFTGSKAHNIVIRKIGQQKELRVNEYGVMKGEKSVAGRSEEDVYAKLGLPWIPPELREDRGEVDGALHGKLPKLIEVGDIRGDLHNHSTASDGGNTIAEMAEAARARGYEYLAITDHSKRLTVANGLDERRLAKQIAEIDKLNPKLKGIHVFKGIEVDILEDGSLDLSDDILGELDLVVASVHHKFNLSRETQTARVLRALDHKYLTILGHPTGRLILDREPFDIDVPKVIEHARQRGCYLELNANPQRLDLNDVYCQMAKQAGVLISIDVDGHSTQDFGNIVYGIGQARRGWLEKKDVLNTRPLKDLLKLLAGTRA